MKSITKQYMLRTPDAAEGEAVEVDPLSQAAGGVDTSFPLLAGDRIVRMEIVKATHGQSKNDKTRNTLTFKFKTQKETTLNDGKTAKPGFTCFKRISTSPSEKTADSDGRTNKDIGRDVALALKAIGRPEVIVRDVLPVEKDDEGFAKVVEVPLFQGQVVDVKVGIAPAKGNFPESNTFSFVLPA